MRRALDILIAVVALAGPSVGRAQPRPANPTRSGADRVDVVLSGAGVIASLPRRPDGTWSARPRFDTRPGWRPDRVVDAGDVLAVSQLTFSIPVPGAPAPAQALSAQIRLGTRECSARATAAEPVDGWQVQWTHEQPRSRADGCHALPGGTWLSVSILFDEVTDTGGHFTAAQIGDVLRAIASAVDEPRVTADRPLANPELAGAGPGRELHTVTLPHSGLVVDLARAGQALALLDSRQDGFLRVLPFFPQTSYSVLVNQQVPGDRTCPNVFELARDLRGGTVGEADLPEPFAHREVLRQGASTIVCEDFAGGFQLIVDLLADQPAAAVVTSNAPLLAELHRAVTAAHHVGAIAMASAPATEVTAPPPPLRHRARRALGNGGFLAGLAGIFGGAARGGDVPDTPGTAGVHVTYVMRKQLRGVVSTIGRTEVELGGGLGGGFDYGVYLDPYGLAIGSHHIFAGLTPGVGLSGLTGGRLDLSWQAGLRATVGVSADGIVALAHARAVFATGDQRQDGAPAAPFGDELVAGVDVIRFGSGQHPVALGLRYRQARRTDFIGAAVSIGLGASAE